jgi:hypothetical protein
MKINVNFLNGNDYWQSKILANAEIAGRLLADAGFLDRIATHPSFDFCADTPVQVKDKILATPEITITVSFFRKWPTKEIAFEDTDGVHFNTRKERAGAGSVGDLIHEMLHELHYSHRGNARAGNENSAPYWIGDEADALVDSGEFK